MTIQTAWGAGTTHIYAISTSEGVILVDSGHGNDASWQTLKQGLQEMDSDMGKIRAVLLTHSHGDHMGLAHHLSSQFGAEIYVHEAEREAVETRSGQWGRSPRCMTKLLLEHGVPEDIVESYVPTRGTHGTSGHSHDDRVPFPLNSVEESRIRSIKDGDVLSFGSFSLTAIHCPGHSPGSTTFWHPGSRTLFAGDHILQRITPNPLIYFVEGDCDKRTRSLPNYLISLAKVRFLPARRVLPGHGAEMDDLPAAIERLYHHHARRAERLLRVMGRESTDAFCLLPALFPHLRPHQLLLGMFEVIGHLDVLVDEGRVVEEKRGGKYHYRAANWR